MIQTTAMQTLRVYDFLVLRLKLCCQRSQRLFQSKGKHCKLGHLCLGDQKFFERCPGRFLVEFFFFFEIQTGVRK